MAERAPSERGGLRRCGPLVSLTGALIDLVRWGEPFDVEDEPDPLLDLEFEFEFDADPDADADPDPGVSVACTG